jgi:protein involved in polysaccharide export with SLBB domain
MFRIQFRSVLLLLLGSVVQLSGQTPESTRRQPATEQQSEEFKRTNTPPPSAQQNYSGAELQRRNSEAKKYYTLGLKFGRARLFKQATEYFWQSIRLKPDHADAYFALGHAYHDLGQWEESIGAFEKAVELNPKDKEAFNMLVTAHEKLRAQQKTTSGGKTAPGQEGIGPPNPSKPRSPSLVELYRVGTGDVLEISFREAPSDQAKLLTVSENGLLEDDLLNQPLNVIGLTPEEITESIKENIKPGANSQKGKVSVTVREYNSHTIMVSGLVKEPGTKILRREAIPLYVVLADAQPLPEAEQVVCVSREEGKPVSLNLAEAQSTNFLVRTGDVITVQAASKKYFYVGGEVKEPGEKLFHAGLTLTQAILSAGGATEKGKLLQLTRESAGGLLATTNYKLKDINSGKLPDPLIQPGDRIMVIH